MGCKTLANLHMVRAVVLELQAVEPSRDLSLVLTKIDKAILLEHENIRKNIAMLNKFLNSSADGAGNRLASS